MSARLICRFIIYKVILKPFLRFVIGVRFPKESEFPPGQYLIIANHNSHLDTVSLLCSIPTDRLLDVHPAAAADYFAKNKLMAFLCEFFLNTVFVRRKGEGGTGKPIDDLDAHVKSGKSLILFPEGTRGRPEEIVDFKNGAAILLQRNPSLNLLPIFLQGMGKAMPKGDGLPLPTECELRVGRLLRGAEFIGKSVPEITDMLKHEVLLLKTLSE